MNFLGSSPCNSNRWIVSKDNFPYRAHKWRIVQREVKGRAASSFFLLAYGCFSYHIDSHSFSLCCFIVLLLFLPGYIVIITPVLDSPNLSINQGHIPFNIQNKSQASSPFQHSIHPKMLAFSSPPSGRPEASTTPCLLGLLLSDKPSLIPSLKMTPTNHVTAPCVRGPT